MPENHQILIEALIAPWFAVQLWPDSGCLRSATEGLHTGKPLNTDWGSDGVADCVTTVGWLWVFALMTQDWLFSNPKPSPSKSATDGLHVGKPLNTDCGSDGAVVVCVVGWLWVFELTAQD